MLRLSSLLVVSLLFPALAWGKADDLQEIKRITEANSRTLGENTQELNAFRQEVQSLKGQIEENKHFYNLEVEKNAKLVRDSDLRLTAMEERLSLYESQLKEFLKPAPVPGKKGLSAQTDDALYRMALSEVNSQNYKEAVGLFDQLLLKFPKSSLADNAQYWKGEALYGLKQFPQAILEFQKVMKLYPKSDKVPGAILKQGYCFYETKAYPDAKAFLQKVMLDYPGSEEAVKAKEKIESIDRAPAVSAAPTAPVTQPTTYPLKPAQP